MIDYEKSDVVVVKYFTVQLPTKYTLKSHFPICD